MKKTIVLLFLLSLFFACKEKARFVEADIILDKWSKASETLNYEEYRKYKAYPREKAVFNEIYKDYYFSQVIVTKVEDLDERDIRTDFEGNSFIKRNVFFECIEFDRQTQKERQRVKGEVFFIKFIGSAREKEGWLMANRTFIRF
ncbi:MAG: hypothetical protein FWG92_03930 [Leptospirales bacterium]|nr:hypothetical protein [Leptospirales bacterium]